LLTLTDQAQNTVRTMTQDPQAAKGAGLRIALGGTGSSSCLWPSWCPVMA